MPFLPIGFFYVLHVMLHFMLHVMFKEVPVFCYTAHPDNAAQFPPKLLPPVKLALCHMGWRFQKDISQSILGIFSRLKQHCKGHEIDFIENTAISTINAVLIIEFLNWKSSFLSFSLATWECQISPTKFSEAISQVSDRVFDKKLKSLWRAWIELHYEYN